MNFSFLKFRNKASICYLRQIKNIYKLRTTTFKNMLNKMSKQPFKYTLFNILKLLESRLDCLLYRYNITDSILQSRQLITHKLIFVNYKLVNSSNYQCKLNDIIIIFPSYNKVYLTKITLSSKMTLNLIHKSLILTSPLLLKNCFNNIII